MMPQTK